MTRVALLGTGLLGTGFAEGMLARGGVELSVWNRTRAKAEALGEKGARVADTPADAVRGAERVHLVLLDDATVDATIDAFKSALGAETIICDHTTNLPRLTAERARRLTSEGVKYLHSPVFMSPMAAKNGTQGIMMSAGPRELFDRVEPGLKVMTGDLWYVGERPDLAACYKLFGNAMILTMAGGIADIFHMSDALKVDRREAFGLFSRFKTEGILPVRGAKILEKNYTASFALEVARKDARLMLESGAGEPMPVIAAIAERMDQLIAAGFGDKDMAIMARQERDDA